MNVLTSPLIGVPHGFPTREGGVSTGPFASLNCGINTADAPASVAENHRLLAAYAQVDGARFRTAIQVHGDTLLEARGTPDERPVDAPTAEADAVWTSAPGVTVGVRTADCLPVLLWDARGGRVAAVHAGWRGVLADLSGKTVRALVAAGCHVGDLRAVVGPSIQKCCFEVDGDLPQRFAEAFGPQFVHAPAGKAKKHLDLQAVVAHSLARTGLSPQFLQVMPECTHCDARFFSHRRDRGNTGRHLSFISCRA